jgi:hypothetical protein
MNARTSSRDLRPGDTVEIIGAAYEDETGELEVYPADGESWWGIPMPKEVATPLINDLNRYRRFRYNDIEHLLVDGD